MTGSHELLTRWAFSYSGAAELHQVTGREAGAGEENGSKRWSFCQSCLGLPSKKCCFGPGQPLMKAIWYDIRVYDIPPLYIIQALYITALRKGCGFSKLRSPKMEMIDAFAPPTPGWSTVSLGIFRVNVVALQDSQPQLQAMLASGIEKWNPVVYSPTLKKPKKYIYIYIQTGSLKTVGQNDIPSRNPVFCVLSGHVFFENLREPDTSGS